MNDPDLDERQLSTLSNGAPQRRLRDRSGGLGGTMLVAGFIGAVALLAWLFTDWQARRDARALLPEQVTLPAGGAVTRLDARRGGHYIASGEINGLPVVFMLDTGASTVAMPVHVAERLGLEGGQAVRSSTANGFTTGREVTLDRVRLGGIELSGVRGFILPNMPGDEVLLGMSFLRKVDFSQQGGMLLLQQRDR